MIDIWWQYNNNHFSYMFDILLFQMHFLLQKLWYFDSKLTEFGPINRNSALDSSNGLLLHKLQAIAWTNDMGQVTKLRPSCYMVLLSIDSKTR